MVFNSKLLVVLANHRCTLRFTETHSDFVKLTLFTSICFYFWFNETKHLLLCSLSSPVL